MAKRFTDSNKFRDIWYRSLKPKHKCLWEFLLSECSLAGMIELDFDAMSFHIGEKITIDDINKLGNRVYFVEANKLFIPKFISFQQGVLNRNNNAHKNIFKELEKYNINESLENLDLKSPSLGATEGLQSPPSKGKGKGKGKDNSNLCKNRANFENEFEEFWSLYPRKLERKKSEIRFVNILKNKEATFEEIIKGLKNYIAYLEQENTEKCFIKHSLTWLNGACWQNEYEITEEIETPF